MTPPAEGSATSTLTFTASTNATPGIATVTVTGNSGALNQSTGIELNVSSSLAQTAFYNAALGAPECAAAGRSCDSGPSLLLGKDTMNGGAEPNQPNTLNNSCADGASGNFHVDESIDRLTVATTTGLIMRQGDMVRVSATVFVAYPLRDTLDLYYATNANNPSWIYIATLKPKGSRSQTLSTYFRLRPGHLQALRANLRRDGSVSSCSTGRYDDHDDLVFAVR